MNIKNLILGIGIVIVFALTLWQGIESFHPSPDYEDFCGEFRTQEAIETPQQCEAIDGQWNPQDSPKPVEGPEGWCDRDFTCRQELESAQDAHSQVVFIASLIVGILALLIGYFILSIEPVGSALIASGIWSIFWGSVVNWRNFTEVWRFILLLIVLVLLIWLALRAAGKTKPSKKKK
ncbi:MAG: hypothetical protein ABIH92_05235 [Nanoarchaeota archaeon]